MNRGEVAFAEFREKFRGELADKYINCKKSLTVYHYTNMQGFQGIIESGKLYFSSMNVLNDETEVYYIWRLVSKNI